MSKTWIIFLLGIALFSAIILWVVISQYMGYFGSVSEPGKNSADWGQFGDYVGGLTNPILTLINILLFVILAINVRDEEQKRIVDAQIREDRLILEGREYEDKRSSEAIRTQKTILLTQMRSNLVNELEKELLVFSDTMDFGKMIPQLHKMKAILTFFITHNNEFFNNSINDKKTVFYGIYKRLGESIDRLVFGIEHDHVRVEDMDDEYRNFFELRTQYISKLNRFIIDQMN